jgi:hypothetical protein
MNVEIPADIQGLDQANAELDRMIAADGEQTSSTQKQEGSDSATEGQRAAQAEKIENVEDPNSLPEKKTDTPAAAEPPANADKAAAEKNDPAKKPDEAKGNEPAKSRYQKAQERQEKTWQELNAQKEAFKTEQDSLKRERDEFEAERLKYQTEREEAEKQFTPEQYENAAKKFEAEGKFDLAELAKAKADDLRRNPPAAREQKAAAATEAQKREWALKAGVDFPEIAKANSPLQVRVAQLFKEEPDMKAHPKGIYLAARLASLEAEAASVSTLKAEKASQEKELGQLRAKVKELEALTAVGGPGDANQRLPENKNFEQMSDSEQFQELSRQAQEVGTLTR